MASRLCRRICRGLRAASGGDGINPRNAVGLFGKRSQLYAFASQIVTSKERKGQDGLLASTNEIFGELPVEPICVRIAVAVKLRSEEHTSELQSLMRISYAVFCLKKKQKIDN